MTLYPFAQVLKGLYKADFFFEVDSVSYKVCFAVLLGEWVGAVYRQEPNGLYNCISDCCSFPVDVLPSWDLASTLLHKRIS